MAIGRQLDRKSFARPGKSKLYRLVVVRCNALRTFRCSADALITLPFCVIPVVSSKEVGWQSYFDVVDLKTLTTPGKLWKVTIADLLASATFAKAGDEITV